MKINIKSPSRRFVLWVPSFLVFNPVTASVAGRWINAKTKSGKKSGVSSRACRKIFKEINRCRRKNKDWRVVDILSPNGEHILIKL
ncbi:MAG: hypothetical protein J6V56_04055 [Clostridia bacterium]|nr:hypothetical protein [Clostridia bacterium]